MGFKRKVQKETSRAPAAADLREEGTAPAAAFFPEDMPAGPERKTPEQLYPEFRRRLMQMLESGEELTDDQIRDRIDGMILTEGRRCALNLQEKESLRRDLFNSIRKLDILQELIDDPEITEIMVNGCDHIFIEKHGRIRRWNKTFSSRERLEDVVRQIAGSCNRIVNEQVPIVDARLENGSRVNIVLAPVALDGPVLTIRRFPPDPITLGTLVRLGSLPQEAAGFLRELVAAGYSVLVGGGTSTGKTTFLNALSGCIPEEERIVTIEDSAELQIQGIPNLVRMEARPANLEGSREITIRDLIRTALRMRPNRILIGEVRGAEAADFLTCLNTGHDGSLGSAHANSVRDMIARIESMVLMASADLPIPVIRRQIAAGVEILIHLVREADGSRRVAEIAEITGMDGDEVQIHTLFGRDADGNLVRQEALMHTEKLDKYRRRTGRRQTYRNSVST